MFFYVDETKFQELKDALEQQIELYVADLQDQLFSKIDTLESNIIAAFNNRLSSLEGKQDRLQELFGEQQPQPQPQPQPQQQQPQPQPQPPQQQQQQQQQQPQQQQQELYFTEIKMFVKEKFNELVKESVSTSNLYES